MSRYKRTAHAGPVILCSSRKGSDTLAFWFYRKFDNTWREFDIRRVAGIADKPLPERMTAEEMRACGECPVMFERLLQRDLQRAAEFCNTVDPEGCITLDVAL